MKSIVFISLVYYLYQATVAFLKWIQIAPFIILFSSLHRRQEDWEWRLGPDHVRLLVFPLAN